MGYWKDGRGAIRLEGLDVCAGMLGWGGTEDG